MWEILGDWYIVFRTDVWVDGMAASNENGTDDRNRAWGLCNCTLLFSLHFPQKSNKAQQPSCRINPVAARKLSIT